MKESTQHLLFLKKNFHFFCFSLKKSNVKKTKKNWSSRGFSTFSVISLTFSIASAALTTSTIISLSAFKWWYKSTIHLECKDFITGELLTTGGSIPFLSYFEISFAIQMLYFSESYAFATLLRLRSSGWNVLVKLCCMITISQSFLA